MFILSLFFAPLIALVPNAATAPVLILVGALMMESIREIDFSDWTEGFPAYLVIVLMPFTYSIANGVAAGLIIYPIIKVITGKHKEVHWFVYVMSAIVLAKYVFFD